MAKINISLPDETLKELDRTAGATGASRSALLVRAFEHYVQELQEKERRQRRARAVDTIRGVAGKLGDWDAVGELLKSRDSH